MKDQRINQILEKWYNSRKEFDRDHWRKPEDSITE